MPLWADALAEQPDRGFEEIFAEPEAPEPDAPPQRRQTLLPAIIAATVAVAALATVTATRDSELTIANVRSAWVDVPMTCDTTRLEADGDAVELFRCRAVGSGVLPPGNYGSPDEQWTSDLTRVDARASRITISPDGALVGWAVY